MVPERNDQLHHDALPGTLTGPCGRTRAGVRAYTDSPGPAGTAADPHSWTDTARACHTTGVDHTAWVSTTRAVALAVLVDTIA